MTQHTLARRLGFAPDNMSLWASEPAWRVRMVFAWQRLVRAGKVQQGRKRSPMWREGERGRVGALAAQHKRETGRDADWASDSARARGQQYTWDLEAAIQEQRSVSNGAAAVMARRRGGAGLPDTQPTAVARGAKRGRVTDDDAAAAGTDLTRNDATATARRSGDSVLVFNTLSLRRLETQLRSTYYWQRAPFGDG